MCEVRGPVRPYPNQWQETGNNLVSNARGLIDKSQCRLSVYIVNVSNWKEAFEVSDVLQFGDADLCKMRMGPQVQIPNPFTLHIILICITRR